MLIMKLFKRTLLKKVLAILLYILRRKMLKGKFVENCFEREIKNGLDKNDSERKSPDSDKKIRKHLKKETRKMLLLAKSFQLAEISFTETYVHIHTKSSSPAKDCTEKTVWLEKDISRKEYFLRAIA